MFFGVLPLQVSITKAIRVDVQKKEEIETQKNQPFLENVDLTDLETITAF